MNGAGMTRHLKVTVLTENAPAEGLRSEHGLSLLVERDDARVLLDFGQSDAFARNATTLGLDLGLVDLAVLSHAHYDHADGMGTFFALNDLAPLYLSEACAEDCWSTKGGTADAHYIGIKNGLLASYESRMIQVPVSQATAIAPGIHLVPHTTPGLAELGRHAGMYLHCGDAWTPDSFAHELTLVVETDETVNAPIAVFSSCSHAGLPTIVAEARAAFPNHPIAAYVGGLHLVHATDDEILAIAKAIRTAGIGRLYTGHCTGSHALELLSKHLPQQVTALFPGLIFDVRRR